MRLIDMDELMDRAVIQRSITTNDSCVSVDDIEDSPTIEAIPVVRCKDCKHNQLPPTSANANCDLWYGMTDLFGYCSWGERKDEYETD